MTISKQDTDKLWLHYFNKTLYEQGLITEEMRNKMMNHINMRQS